MALNSAEVIVALWLVGAGCGLTYVILRRKFQREVSELQSATDRQLSAILSTLKSLETRVAELSRPRAMSASAMPVPAPVAGEAATLAAKAAVLAKEEEEVTPEILVVIAAAVAAFLGKKVRIRSAKMLQSPYEIVNPWSQQGRVRVQASHNLRPRK